MYVVVSMIINLREQLTCYQFYHYKLGKLDTSIYKDFTEAANYTQNIDSIYAVYISMKI